MTKIDAFDCHTNVFGVGQWRTNTRIKSAYWRWWCCVGCVVWLDGIWLEMKILKSWAYWEKTYRLCSKERRSNGE